jgi:hypothetical protein
MRRQPYLKQLRSEVGVLKRVIDAEPDQIAIARAWASLGQDPGSTERTLPPSPSHLAGSSVTMLATCRMKRTVILIAALTSALVIACTISDQPPSQWASCVDQPYAWNGPQIKCAGPERIVEELNQGVSPEIVAVYEVCHGEDQRICTLHPHVRFEPCNSGDQVTETYPIASSLYLCGVGSHGQPRNFSVETTYTGVSGGYCGYAWFELRCYK